MKRIFSIFLALLLTCSSATALAGEMYVVEQKGITVTYNGDSIPFPDAQPTIENGSTLVPVRAIMERSELLVDFDGEAQKVTAGREGLFIEMTLGSTEAIVKEGDSTRTVTMAEPARIIDSRTFVPIRFIAESMNLSVNWNANYREVIIIDTAEWKQEMAESSKLLCYFLDLADHHSGAIAGSFAGELTIKDETNPLSMNLAGANVFDGTNTGFNINFGADLKHLEKLLPANTNLNPTLLTALSKSHNGNLDVVLGSDGTVYLNGPVIASILSDCGMEAAGTIGSRYVSIPTTEFFAALLGVDETLFTTGEDSPWDMLSALITADKNLYSQSVALIDDMVRIMAELYRDEAFFQLDSYGTPLWRYRPNKEEFQKLSKELSQHLSAIFGTEPKESTSIPEIVMALDKNGLPAQIELARETESLAFSFGISSHKFDNYKDGKVSLPKNSIPLEEILGQSLEDFLRK